MGSSCIVAQDFSRPAPVSASIPLDMATTRFIVLRHGETTWNRDERYQGHLDSPLTELGLAQAWALAHRLAKVPSTALYSSDLGRAVLTANIIAKTTGHEVRIETRLRERNLGVLQGHRVEDVKESLPDAYRLFKKGTPDQVVPEGESSRARYECVTACFEELAERHPGEQIVVVTHGGVLSCLARFVLGLPLEAPRRFTRPNAGWNRFRCQEGKWFLDTWGDISHLETVSASESP
jgi:probable phosphoglycerate mutase